MLYYKDDTILTHCKFYAEARFKPKKEESGVANSMKRLGLSLRERKVGGIRMFLGK